VGRASARDAQPRGGNGLDIFIQSKSNIINKGNAVDYLLHLNDNNQL